MHAGGWFEIAQKLLTIKLMVSHITIVVHFIWNFTANFELIDTEFYYLYLYMVIGYS